MLDHQTYDSHEEAQRCCGCGGGDRSAAPVAAETVVDPVCGMKVDPAKSRHHLEHGGKTYFFCCGGCRTSFAADHGA